MAAARPSTSGCSKPPAPPATSTSITPPHATACRIGIRAHRPGGARRLAGRVRDPFNDPSPLSSAAAIGAQGLLRLGRILSARGRDGSRYERGGLRALETLLDEPHLTAARSIKASCFTPSTIGPTAGTTRPPDRGFRAVNRVSGAITTTGARTLRSAARQRRSLPDLLRSAMTQLLHSSPAARAASGWASRAGWRPKAGNSRSAARARPATFARPSRRYVARPHASSRAFDISQPADRRRLVADVRDAFAGVNALVNNAGRAARVRADLLEATKRASPS